MLGAAGWLVRPLAAVPLQDHYSVGLVGWPLPPCLTVKFTCPTWLDAQLFLASGTETFSCWATPPAEDGRVFYWELVDAQLVESFQAHADVVCSLAMHPRGECLLTSSVDGTVKVWT